MKRIIKTTLLVSLIAVGLLAKGEAESITGRQIMQQVKDRPNGNDRVMTMTMTLVNKRSHQRVRSLVVYAKDFGKDSKSIFYFKKPADVKGTGFLIWGYDNPDRDDDRWLYLPALKRARRISGSSKNDYFMGSDLTYDDMGSRAVDEDVHTILGEETVSGHACWKIKSVSKDKSYLYSKVISYVIKDSYVVVKGVFYDRRGTLLKTIVRSNIKKHQGYWTAFKTVVHNLQDNHKTILSMSKVRYNTGMRSSLFRVSTLERGRIR